MDTEHRLILASNSPRRRTLLADAGYTFEVMPSAIAEPQLAREGLDPQVLAEALAYFKARDVADRCGRGKVVLAADTVVAFAGTIFGKAANADRARTMLRTLSRQKHRVISAVAVVDADTGSRRIDSATTWVTMTPLGDEQLDAIIAGGTWYDKAGAYAIQEGADKYVTELDGSFTNVVGLPMELVPDMLAAFGIHRTEGEVHAESDAT